VIMSILTIRANARLMLDYDSWNKLVLPLAKG
jgi:hypothetical protein